jgi:hypothetical protein
VDVLSIIIGECLVVVFNEKWREIVARVRLEEKGSWGDAGKAIAEYFPNLSTQQLREKARTEMRRRNRAGYTSKSVEDVVNPKVTYKENGEMTFEGVVSLLS